jgi:AcrR family transcriptional regulator/DNA-binding MarR family transcriptional regulator
MIASLAEVTRERGLAGTTVAHIVERSGVSRRTFYELFDDREDCFRAAFDQTVERGAQRVRPAFEDARGWREQMRAGLRALLEFLEDEPDLGALCVVDALGAGPAALARRAQIVSVLVDAVDAGSMEARGSAQPTRLTAEGVVGAVLAVLHARLSQVGSQNGRPPAAAGGYRERPAAGMDGLLGPLMGMIVLPYLGQAVAAREAARPVSPPRRVSPAHGDPLRDLDMRLTYRTLRVLVAAAAHPGASNRAIGDAAGVADQGQISKLLARLEHLGLIRNEGAGPARGEPNAWRLTPRGGEIERTIRQETPADMPR